MIQMEGTNQTGMESTPVSASEVMNVECTRKEGHAPRVDIEFTENAHVWIRTASGDLVHFWKNEICIWDKDSTDVSVHSVKEKKFTNELYIRGGNKFRRSKMVGI